MKKIVGYYKFQSVFGGAKFPYEIIEKWHLFSGDHYIVFERGRKNSYKIRLLQKDEQVIMEQTQTVRKRTLC